MTSKFLVDLVKNARNDIMVMNQSRVTNEILIGELVDYLRLNEYSGIDVKIEANDGGDFGYLQPFSIMFGETGIYCWRYTIIDENCNSGVVMLIHDEIDAFLSSMYDERLLATERILKKWRDEWYLAEGKAEVISFVRWVRDTKEANLRFSSAQPIESDLGKVYRCTVVLNGDRIVIWKYGFWNPESAEYSWIIFVGVEIFAFENFIYNTPVVEPRYNESEDEWKDPKYLYQA